MLKHLKTVFILLPLIIAYLTLQLVMQSGKVEKTLTLSVPEKIGIDEELMERIDQLEKDITRRLNYEVELARDPLNLAAIVQVNNGKGKGKEFSEQQRSLRLSCTILSPKKSTAVIKHRSKSYVVSEGDKILNWQVKSISKKQVVLQGSGGELILKNKPAPKIEQFYDEKRAEEASKL